jgi:hypothetical protein
MLPKEAQFLPPGAEDGKLDVSNLIPPVLSEGSFSYSSFFE